MYKITDKLVINFNWLFGLSEETLNITWTKAVVCLEYFSNSYVIKSYKTLISSLWANLLQADNLIPFILLKIDKVNFGTFTV